MLLNTILCFIKFAFAGTGSANDINSLLFILIILLVIFFAIPYLVSYIHRLLINRTQNEKIENENSPKDLEVFDDFDYF